MSDARANPPRSLLITGCSSGIGHAAAHAMAARGWRVFATARAEADVARHREEGLEALPTPTARWRPAWPARRARRPSRSAQWPYGADASTQKGDILFLTRLCCGKHGNSRRAS
ncbi:SDR family NAD(P)-dependent oxidoreductase [Halomonas sp. MA07-2]|uniref:SDR family NAD(P)-dependent oxidoreductase n=1 Tax=Halomonas sp. MA07-2 TaxID=3440841 RepID=UPI003EF04226